MTTPTRIRDAKAIPARPAFANDVNSCILDYYIYVRYLWGMKWIKENWFKIVVIVLLVVILSLLI